MKGLMKVSSGVGAAMILTASLAEAVPPRARCVANLVICMNDAAELPTWFQRSVAGADCGLEFASCVNALF
jgi:hypothetical protein